MHGQSMHSPVCVIHYVTGLLLWLVDPEIQRQVLHLGILSSYILPTCRAVKTEATCAISWFDIAMPAAPGACTQIAVERAGRDLPLRLLRACWIRASYDWIDSMFRPAVSSVQRSKWAAVSHV